MSLKMSLRHLLLGVLIFGFASCGTTRRMQSTSVVSVADTTASRPVRILHPKPGGYTVSETTESLRTVESSPSETSSRTASKSGSATDRPSLIFNSTQSSNIRVPGVNPLPSEGILALPLDRMAEEFCYPYRGKLISDYGMRGRSMHTGIDIKAVPNDTIRAAFPGVVRMSKYYSGYGNLIVIQHYDGFETCYAHHSRNLVKVNDVVEAGTPIALAGRTGRATTEHLHFELRAEGEPLDPKTLVDPDTYTLREGLLYIQRSGNGLIAYNAAAGTPPRDLSAETNQDSRKVSETPSSRPTAATVSSQSTAKAASSTPIYYRVQKGDTLYAIARRYGTTVKKICALNGISEKALLQINQRLRVK